MAVTEVEYTEVNRETKTDDYKPIIVWKNAIGFLALHLGAVYGLYLIATLRANIYTTAWMFGLGFISGFSITAGAHRLWSHRAYKATIPLKIFLIFGQTLAGQNCLWVWVRDHRQHHKYSDTDADPHNASRGFFFSHMGWLMTRKHPQVLAKGKTVDMSDLDADPIVMFQKRHYKKLYFSISIFLPAILPCFFWGERFLYSFVVSFVTRFVLSVNFTWLVNSYAHMFGTKPYTKDIVPVESPLVSLLGMGEGWHNYHHTFPWDYRAAEYGTDPNVTTHVLDLLAWFGMVYDRRYATQEMVKHRVIKKGDGSHSVWGFKTTSEYY